MILVDIIVLLILAVPAGIGIYRGFTHMFLHALGWIGALVAALFFSRPVSGVLNNGFLWDMIYQRLSDKFLESTAAVETASEGLPGIISGGLSIGGEAGADVFAELLTSVLVSVIGFVLIMLLARVLLQVLIRPVAKRDGFVLLRGADKLLGFVAGLLEGIVLVFVFLMGLMLFQNLAGEDMSELLVGALGNSFIAGTLYDNNLLMLVTGGLFS